MRAAPSPVEELIREEIARRGPLPFADFMALALYHPTLGYYAGGGVGREPLGWEGDYFTSGDLSPLWGETLARQLAEMWEALGRPARFDVVEPGAGRGLLAREVWRYALGARPDWAAALRYTLLDRAPAGSPLRAEREARLAAELAALSAPGGATRWASDVGELAPITGCVLSNELVDALPFHIVEKRGDALREVYVGVDTRAERETRLCELLGEPSSPAIAAYLDAFGVPWREFPDGWRAEISLEARAWLRRMAETLRRGFILTLDYGETARRLYTRDRRHGTLAVYARHQLLDDPLARPGQHDITAHVNFTALIEEGRAHGLRLAGLTTQRELLERLGIREQARALAQRLYPAAGDRTSARGQLDYLRRATLRNAVETLLNPSGLGGFRALALQRGVPGASRRLTGFRQAASAPSR